MENGEIEGTCITRAKFWNVPHKYSTIVGIEESIQEILLNLEEIVLRSNLYGVRDASICVKGLLKTSFESEPEVFFLTLVYYDLFIVSTPPF